MAGLDPPRWPRSSPRSTGDPPTATLLCEALAGRRALVSPTRFTNSVHNVAGRLLAHRTQAIARVHQPGGLRRQLRRRLLEAAVQCVPRQAPVLLVACDVPYPEPLHAVRPVADVMAVALVLVPLGRPRLSLAWPVTPPPTPCTHARPGSAAPQASRPHARCRCCRRWPCRCGHAGAGRPAGGRWSVQVAAA
jgi:hypothetical protein